MNDLKWALLRPDEDGNPVKWLNGERELRDMLANPQAWGISEFVHIDDMDVKDPAYWKTGQAMLMRVEVVVPVLGGWRLPEDCGPMPAAATEWMMGREGPVRLDSVHDTTKPVGSFNIVSATPEGAAITLEKAYDPFRLGGVGASPLKLGDVQE